MISNKFLVKLNDTYNEVYNYLLGEYKIKKESLTTSSPYLQILKFNIQFKNVILLLLEDAIGENNILTARKRRSIEGHALLSGHNPMRANCSKGVITLNITHSNNSLVDGDYIVIPNNTILKNKLNNLNYSLLLNSKQLLVNKNDLTTLDVSVVQGTFKKVTYIASGTDLQSFDIGSSTTDVFIDNEHIYVTVNGVKYTNYTNLWDMDNESNGVIIRSSLKYGSRGLNVVFGNTTFGGSLPKGAIIEVTYLETSGVYGNLYSDLSSIDFTWDSDIYDNLGNSINGDDVFDIIIDNEIGFGTNPESTSFTKLILNKFSQVNVLGNTSSYITFFKRLGLFSYVNAYTKDDINDNTIYVMLIPNLKRKLESVNYFNLPLDSYKLSDFEKNQYYDKLVTSGKQLPNSHIEIIDPTIKKYILNINLRIFNNNDVNTIKETIANKLSEYFYLIRRNKIVPKSDIIRIIEDINGIDSVNVHFLCEDNENALSKGFYYKSINNELVKIDVIDSPNLGLNPFGDIIINDNEIAVIKGGWYDSNEQFYNDEFSLNGSLTGLNITIFESNNMSVLDEIIQNKLREL